MERFLFDGDAGDDSERMETGVCLSPANPREWSLLCNNAAIEDLESAWTVTDNLRLDVDSSDERLYRVDFQLAVSNYGYLDANMVRIRIAYAQIIGPPVDAHIAGEKWWRVCTHPADLGYFGPVPGTRGRSPSIPVVLHGHFDLARGSAGAELTHVFLGVFDTFSDPLRQDAASFLHDPDYFPDGPRRLGAAPHIRKLSRQIATWAAPIRAIDRFTLIRPEDSPAAYDELDASEATWMFEVHMKVAPIGSATARLEIEGAGPGLINVPLDSTTPIRPLVVAGSTIPGWLRFRLFDQIGTCIKDELCAKSLINPRGVVELTWRLPPDNPLYGCVVRLVHR